jgi:hypothetical protein
MIVNAAGKTGKFLLRICSKIDVRIIINEG